MKARDARSAPAADVLDAAAFAGSRPSLNSRTVRLGQVAFEFSRSGRSLICLSPEPSPAPCLARLPQRRHRLRPPRMFAVASAGHTNAPPVRQEGRFIIRHAGQKRLAEAGRCSPGSDRATARSRSTAFRRVRSWRRQGTRTWRAEGPTRSDPQRREPRPR